MCVPGSIARGAAGETSADDVSHGSGETRAPAGYRLADVPGLLSSAELADLDAFWRAANYLSVGQIYLMDNPLLSEPLRPEHVKPRLLGHWGTTPGRRARRRGQRPGPRPRQRRKPDRARGGRSHAGLRPSGQHRPPGRGDQPRRCPAVRGRAVGFGSLFGGNVTLAGGPAPVRAYIEQQLPEVLDGTVQPGKVFDQTVALDDTPKGLRRHGRHRAQGRRPAVTTSSASPVRNPAAILAIILISYFMIVLDNSVIFTGLPSIRDGLDLTPSALSRVQDGAALMGSSALLSVALLLRANGLGGITEVRRPHRALSEHFSGNQE
jgi:hypothetical protein